MAKISFTWLLIRLGNQTALEYEFIFESRDGPINQDTVITPQKDKIRMTKFLLWCSFFACLFLNLIDACSKKCKKRASKLMFGPSYFVTALRKDFFFRKYLTTFCKSTKACQDFCIKFSKVFLFFAILISTFSSAVAWLSFCYDLSKDRYNTSIF